MTGPILAIALGATALSNFPRDAGGKVAHQATGVTFGGAPVALVAAGERVVALNGDGGQAFTIALGAGEAAAGPPAAGDTDGDGRLEIAVVTASGKLHLWSGGAVSGFPLNLGARAKAGPSFVDVDGDGRPEVVVGDERGRVHAYKRNGRQPTGWPANVGSPVTSSVSSAVLGGGRSFAVGCEDGRVHVLDATGRSRSGFPLVTRFTVTGAPVFADLDDDGEMDLVVASQDFGLHAVNGRGVPLPGFPAKAGYRLYDGPAVADLDGDRRLDVAFASADGMVHAVDGTGARLPGFPVRAGVRLFGGPALADLDRDGRLDVAVVLADGAVAAFDPKGKPLAGFPSPPTGADVTASPLALDLLGDRTPAVLFGMPNGRVHAVRASRGGGAEGAIAWSGPGRDAARSGRYGPNAPTYKDLALTPGEPRALDGMRAKWRSVWLDLPQGEPMPAPKIEWRRNGKAVPGLEGKAEVPPGTARRSERWRFVLGSPRGETVVESPEVVLLDTPPTEPEVAIEPAVPTRGGDVRARLLRPATDPDGDPITYAFSWLLDGLDTGVAGEVYPADRLRRNALLTARVVASDGELSGPAGSAVARVGDTAPGAPKIGLEPQAPARTDAVRARIEAPAVDPDGDSLVYHYRWTAGGEPLNLPLGTSILPAGLFRKHQKVEVEVRAFDGELAGPPVRASATAKNTPPTAPRVEIRPPRPRKGEALRAAIVEPARDADGDPLTYRFSWTKNGAPFGAAGEGREIPGAEVARADRFELTVTANDGEATGPRATAMAAVANTPPVPPRISVEPRRPVGGETLKLVILEPARDVDGETVGLGIAWSRDGRPTGSGAETLPPSQFRKGERVRVVVTPRDGEESGPVASFEVLVEDAPPTAPAVAFATDRPAVTSPLRVAVKTPATDPDGDGLRYEYRWLRDGAPVALADGSERSKLPPFWTSASEVPANELRKGQRWEVEVRAHDGERHGPSATAAVAIVNSPPPAPRLLFSPERPRRVDGIGVSIEQPPDPDGDRITYRYAWTRSGKPFAAPPEQAQIPRNEARKGERWVVEVVASDGEAESPAVRHEGVIAGTAPGPTAVTLCDGPVPAGTVLQARIALAASDADGDAVTYRHEWTVNDRPVPAATGQVRLAAPALQKHDRVRVTVTPWDGDLAGPPAAAECAVVNRPPAAPGIALEPAEPAAPRGVSVTIRKPSTDRDGDAVVYRYAWWRDGVPAPFDGPAIPGATMRHGELWRVEVTPFDGEEEGERAEARTVVRNTPPAAPSVVLAPASPGVGEAITCDARTPERDADQEAVSLGYRWFRDGKHEPFAEGTPSLPPGLVRRGEKWRCESWAWDGHAESGRVFAELGVRNTPPPAPQVAVEPEAPRRGDDLTCRITGASADPDGDEVTYAYAWWKDDRPVPAGPDPARVDADKVSKGERWRCSATPSDGTATGTAGVGAAVVANSPPKPAVVKLQPSVPKDGQPLRCEIVTKSVDPDADAVRYRFVWQRNGSPQPFADSSQEVPARLVKGGDRWRCTATPTDGSEEGPSTGSEEVLVLGSGG